MTVRLAGAFLALTTAFALSLSGPAHAQPDHVQGPKEPPPPGEVKVAITKVDPHGSGCKGATAFISPDKSAFTVVYSGYLAQVGVGAGSKDHTKYCRIRLKLDVPKGYTFAIGQSIHRGFADLAAGATGVHLANFGFQGSKETPRVEHSFKGPLEGDYWQQNGKAGTELAPCKKTKHLDINTELKVNVGTSDPKTTTSMLGVDSSDGAFTAHYPFGWKKC